MKISNERLRRWGVRLVVALIALGGIALFVAVVVWASGHAGS